MELTLNLPENIEKVVKEQAEKQGVSLEAVIETVILDSLEKSAVEPDAPPVHPQREQMLKEVTAYKKLHAELVKGYLGNYVAIFQGQLVDSDQSPENLFLRVKEKFPNQVVLQRKVEDEPERVIHFRSPKIISR
ncbi:MAG: hypothetical protein ACI9EW_003102 [Cellvibrionaceae bacterium]|jgi:hypothetical protein